MRVRFQADNDLDNDIVKGVLRRMPGVDFQDAQTAGLHGMPDRDVLQLCAAVGRILVSHDLKTMPVHFGEFAREHSSPGVLIIRQGFPIAKAIESLVDVWELSEPEEWQNRLCLAPDFKPLLIGEFSSRTLSQ